jgi:membrane protease subunit (stomatin/prohibitin family)
MGLFRFLKSQYIQSIEWTDTPSRSIVQQIPLSRRLIKMGAALHARESQVAVIVNEGKVADVFEPGSYTLTQENLPVLSAQRLWKVGHKSSFRADVYYVSTKPYIDLTWETVNPIIIKSHTNGDIRVQASGTFTIRVTSAEKFMKEIFGSNQIYDTPYMLGQFRSKLFAGLAHTLNETKISIRDYASHYDEISEHTENKLQEQFAAYGFELNAFIVKNINVLEDVKEPLTSVDEVAVTSIYTHIEPKEAIKVEAVKKTQDTVVHSEALSDSVSNCHDCGHPMTNNMKFCSDCGSSAKHEKSCSCGYSHNDSVKYCPYCGLKVVPTR